MRRLRGVQQQKAPSFRLILLSDTSTGGAQFLTPPAWDNPGGMSTRGWPDDASLMLPVPAGEEAR